MENSSHENGNELQEYIDSKYGSLDFWISQAMLSTIAPQKVTLNGNELRYFSPESVVYFEKPQVKNLYFSIGGSGRAVALADEMYLNFQSYDKMANLKSEAKVQLPRISEESKALAKKDHSYAGSVFSISAEIPSFPFLQTGYIDLMIEFHFDDEKFIELLGQHDNEDPVAIYAQEILRFVVNVDEAGSVGHDSF